MLSHTMCIVSLSGCIAPPSHQNNIIWKLLLGSLQFNSIDLKTLQIAPSTIVFQHNFYLLESEYQGSPHRFRKINCQITEAARLSDWSRTIHCQYTATLNCLFGKIKCLLQSIATTSNWTNIRNVAINSITYISLPTKEHCHSNLL